MGHNPGYRKGMVEIMDKRSEVFQMFGPKLLEGFLELIFDQFNLLRTHSGYPPLTKQQVYDEIMNHANSLPDYDWMEGT